MKKDISSSKILYIGIGISLVLTGLIWFFAPALSRIELLPDTGFLWYYWKLPEPDFWARISSWSLYIIHQVLAWVIIYKAFTADRTVKKVLSKWNWAMLIVNLVFIILHLIQTHLFYDGLAQDTPIWASQGSVIVMLVLILIIENPRRGMFFGKKAPLPKFSISLVRKYHGFFIAWALVYTFWYHPAEGTIGHLMGFFYMFLLFLQMSLMYTRSHMNKYWTFSLEVFVLVHGAIVAVMNANGIWPMFAFGFGAIAVVTQIYGLGLKRWQLIGITLAYIALVLVVYTPLTVPSRSIVDTQEIIRIPVIEYALVFIFAYLLAVPRLFLKNQESSQKNPGESG
ncbi:MAG: hypothetical protein ACLFR1_06880 [Spirochaetia bacterium]